MDESLRDYLAHPASIAAHLLLGSEIERELDGEIVKVMIVETEAYDGLDEASHSFRGITPRTQVMFGPAGFAYVYFTYGMHYCFNVVTGHAGEGSGVLIRAVEPIAGQKIIMANRFPKTGYEVTNGPAKVCQALQINRDLNGHNLEVAPLRLVMKQPLNKADVMQTPRIGISKAIDKPWRFYIKNNPYVSKNVTKITNQT